MLYRTTLGRSSFLLNESTLSGLSRYQAVILCIHGMYGGAWYYRLWLKQFKREGFGALSLDLRGHHGAALLHGQKLDEVTTSDYVNDVAAAIGILENAGIARSRIVLIGHSMGGLVSQMYAAENEIRALVLVASAVPRIQSVYRQFFGDISFSFEGRQEKRILLPPDERKARRLFFGIPEPVLSETISRLVPESARARDEVAHGISLNPLVPQPPTLIIAGRRDPIVPPALLYGLHLAMPGSRFVVYRSGHFPMLESNAERIAHHIARWAGKAISRQ